MYISVRPSVCRSVCLSINIITNFDEAISHYYCLTNRLHYGNNVQQKVTILTINQRSMPKLRSNRTKSIKFAASWIQLILHWRLLSLRLLCHVELTVALRSCFRSYASSRRYSLLLQCYPSIKARTSRSITGGTNGVT